MNYQLFISSVDQIAGLSRFKAALALFEAGGADTPPPVEFVAGTDENSNPLVIAFVPPGVSYGGLVHAVNIVTSRDLDQVDPMIQQMNAGNNADGINVADVTIKVRQ